MRGLGTSHPKIIRSEIRRAENDRALERFADAAVAVDDPDHPDHDAAVEAANGVTVVRLHDEFGASVLAMRAETEP